MADRPIHGPEQPTLDDAYRWLDTRVDGLDVDDATRELLHEAIADALDYLDHEC